MPWLPSPTGWLDGLLGEDERQGVLYMKSVYQLWREIQQGAAVEECWGFALFPFGSKTHLAKVGLMSAA